jgi:hypothetical protein
MTKRGGDKCAINKMIAVTTRLFQAQNNSKFFFIYIYIPNTHGAGNQRT